MRYAPGVALAGAALLLLALGPVVLVVVGLLLLLEPVRRRLRTSRRVLTVTIGVVAGLVGLTVLVPDGWLPVPPGSGRWVTPGYLGRPAFPQALDVPTPAAGPLGESPEVDTAWYGAHRCAPLLVDGGGQLVARCQDRSHDRLLVVDPDTLRVRTDKELPAADDDGEACTPRAPVLDEAGLVTVPTVDRRVLRLATRDAEQEADLTVVGTQELGDLVPADDCLLGLDVAPDGTTWVVSEAGRVLVLRGRTDERPGLLDLGETVSTPPTALPDGGALLVTDEAVYRVRRDGGRPLVAWRSPYDRGARTKAGQPSRGSGTAPVLLGSGLVVTADNAVPRMHVEFRSATDGALVCRTPVFADGASATRTPAVAVGPASAVVTNHHASTGLLATRLGRAPEPGLARVDVVDGDCRVRWTAAVSAPGAAPVVAGRDGLVHVVTKRPSWWGVDAWYLTALDARSGRTAFAVRLGTGALSDARDAAVTLGPDGAAYVATRGGLVRVRDRQG